MKWTEFVSRRLAVICLAFMAALSFAQAQPATEPSKEPAKEFVPNVGQSGKDVIWVPTAQTLVDKMLDMAKVTPKDYVIDLGSGDGRTVITAAKRGARALGIEYNPDMVQLATRNAAKEKVGDKAKFIHADIFQTDFSQATVITLFLLPQLNVRLRPTLMAMKPGLRIVSNTFDMGDWEPEEKVRLDDCSSHCNALFWIVPANVQGLWKWSGGQLVIEQKYQMLTGTLKDGSVYTPITNAKMTGDKIAFNVGDVQYTGVVKGDSIRGTRKAGTKETRWQARRNH
jgi:SAM-dependent methyltransferase